MRVTTLIPREPFILDEVRENLRIKFKFPESDVQETLEILHSVAEIVIPEPLKIPVCQDTDDDIVLAMAITGQVACVISGDKDLTDLESFQGIPILKNPRSFEHSKPNEVENRKVIRLKVLTFNVQPSTFYFFNRLFNICNHILGVFDAC